MGSDAQTEEPDASKPKELKRRKKGKTEPKSPETPKESRPERKPVSKPAGRTTKTSVKKPQHDREVDVKSRGTIAQGKRPVGQNDEAEQAEKFFKEKEMARFGAINDVQLSKRTRAKDGLLDDYMNPEMAASGVSSHEQQLLESFFIPFGPMKMDSDAADLAGDTVAQHRMDYVRPYTESPDDAKNNPKGDRKKSPSKRDWRKLSLKHRLNLIKGLQEIEDHEPKTPRKAWDDLAKRAQGHRKELVEGQNWLAEPTSWEDYNDMNAARKGRKGPAGPGGGGGKGGDDDDDDEGRLGGPEPSTKKPQKKRDSEKKETKKTKSQETRVWTEEHETYLQQLLDGTEEDEDGGDEEDDGVEAAELEDEEAADSDKEDTALSRPPYNWLELEMMERFIRGRNQNGGGAWGQLTDNMRQLARAHELFFRRWPLPRNKEGKPYAPRQPQAMYRRLKDRGDKARFTGILKKKDAPKTSNVKAQKESGGKNAEDHLNFGGKKLPDGKGGEDDNDDEASEDNTSQKKPELNSGGHPNKARKPGIVKTTKQIEEVVQNTRQDYHVVSDGEGNDKGESSDEDDESSHVEMDGQGGNDGSDDLDRDDDDDKQSVEDDRDGKDEGAEDQGKGNQDDDLSDSSGSENMSNTRH